jgi:uncharacterized membrane protein YjgN (DUF898 family)
MQPRGSDSWGVTVVNVVGVIIAVVVYWLLTGWAASLQVELWGTGPISGTWRIHVVPLLAECLAAALVGLALGALLRTGRPAVYAGLLAAAFLLQSALTWTIGQPRLWDVIWIGLMVLLPAAVAGAVTLWVARNRGGAAPALSAAS